MRTFLNHITNETLDEIKTSLENMWQRMIQLSEFFQYSFVLILKRKCLVGASRVRCGESGTPSTIIYTRWSSRHYELECDAPVIMSFIFMGIYIKSGILHTLKFHLHALSFSSVYSSGSHCQKIQHSSGNGNQTGENDDSSLTYVCDQGAFQKDLWALKFKSS